MLVYCICINVLSLYLQWQIFVSSSSNFHEDSRDSRLIAFVVYPIRACVTTSPFLWIRSLNWEAVSSFFFPELKKGESALKESTLKFMSWSTSLWHKLIILCHSGYRGRRLVCWCDRGCQYCSCPVLLPAQKSYRISSVWYYVPIWLFGTKMKPIV